MDQVTVFLFFSFYFCTAKYQDLDESQGKIKVREAGVYLVAANIALKDAQGSFEIGRSLHVFSCVTHSYQVCQSIEQ